MEPRSRVSSERQRACAGNNILIAPKSEFWSSSEHWRPPVGPEPPLAGAWHLAAPQSDRRFLRPAHGNQGGLHDKEQGPPNREQLKAARRHGPPNSVPDRSLAPVRVSSEHSRDIPTITFTALWCRIVLSCPNSESPRRSGHRLPAGAKIVPLLQLGVNSEHPQDIPTIQNCSTCPPPTAGTETNCSLAPTRRQPRAPMTFRAFQSCPARLPPTGAEIVPPPQLRGVPELLQDIPTISELLSVPRFSASTGHSDHFRAAQHARR